MSLCDLPPELLQEVLCEYTAKSDLLELCLVSRSFHKLCSDIIYAAVTLNLLSTDSTPFRLLCRTLLTNLKLALSVRRLRIKFYVKPRDEPPTVEASNQLRELALVITACKNLQALSVVHAYGLTDIATENFADSLAYGSQLRELEVYVRDTQWGIRIPGDTDVNISLLPVVLGLPSITSLAVTLQEGVESRLHKWLLPKNNNITKLSLSQTCLNLGCLGKVLAAVPQVKELTLYLLMYADTTYTHIGRHLDCERLGHALAVGFSTLEKLKIAVHFEARTAFDVGDGSGEDCRWGLLGRLGSLQSCTRLKSLEISPEILLGWEESNEVLLPRLLPPFLDSLCFRWDFGDWSYSPWEVDLVENYLNLYQPTALKHLKMLCINGQAEQGRTSIDAIESKCRELGIYFDLGRMH